MGWYYVVRSADLTWCSLENGVRFCDVQWAKSRHHILVGCCCGRSTVKVKILCLGGLDLSERTKTLMDLTALVVKTRGWRQPDFLRSKLLIGRFGVAWFQGVPTSGLLIGQSGFHRNVDSDRLNYIWLRSGSVYIMKQWRLNWLCFCFGQTSSMVSSSCCCGCATNALDALVAGRET